MQYEAIARRLAEEPARHQILCGDLSSPWDEDDSGPLIQSSKMDESSRRWRAAELGIVSNPAMRDAYRDVHRAGSPFPVSCWTGGGTPKGHRYDYVLCSRSIRVRSCEYLGDWLEPAADHGRLSDHPPVEEILEPASA